MYEMLVKPKEKYGIQQKAMPVQKKSSSKYEPLGYTRSVPAESSSGDNGVIQMWQLMSKAYGATDNFQWNGQEQEDFHGNVGAAIGRALRYLDNFIDRASKQRDSLMAELVQYARDVKEVLSDSALEIYPMRSQTSWGQAAAGPHEISLNVDMIIENNGGVESAKTLIHEAFHIIGGCTKGNEKGCTSTGIDVMLKEMRRKKREAINADTFAQFVICYQP